MLVDRLVKYLVAEKTRGLWTNPEASISILVPTPAQLRTIREISAASPPGVSMPIVGASL